MEIMLVEAPGSRKIVVEYSIALMARTSSAFSRGILTKYVMLIL